MWLCEKKGSHTKLLAKQFHQAFYWFFFFFKILWQLHLKILHQNNYVCMKLLYLACFCSFIPQNLIFASLFEISSFFNSKHINKCWPFMAQYHLCVKYFIHKLNPDLTDQMKKAEYILHPDLLCGWKWVGGRLRILLCLECYGYFAVHFWWIFLCLFLLRH